MVFSDSVLNYQIAKEEELKYKLIINSQNTNCKVKIQKSNQISVRLCGIAKEQLKINVEVDEKSKKIKIAAPDNLVNLCYPMILIVCVPYFYLSNMVIKNAIGKVEIFNLEYYMAEKRKVNLLENISCIYLDITDKANSLKMKVEGIEKDRDKVFGFRFTKNEIEIINYSNSCRDEKYLVGLEFKVVLLEYLQFSYKK